MIKQKPLFSRPKKAFELTRIKEENTLLKKYGLKNKREVWKTLARINYFRRRAKELASAPQEEQVVFLNKLKNLGLTVETTADVLDLKPENLLERRLPTIVAKKKMATTPQQARQLVVHKKVLISGNVVNAPSYIVKTSEENEITIKESKKPKAKKAEDTPNPEPTPTPETPEPTPTPETPKPEEPVPKTPAPESTPQPQTSSDNQEKPEAKS
jgi:small subunit ribosomal protein S4